MRSLSCTLVADRRRDVEVPVTKWLRRSRSTVLIGLASGASWVPVGVMTGGTVDSDDSMDEVWVVIGGYPGFLCGAVFSIVVRSSKGDAMHKWRSPNIALGES